MNISDIRKGTVEADEVDWSNPKNVALLVKFVCNIADKLEESNRIINQHAKTINRLATKLAAKQEPSPNSIFHMVFGSR